MLALVLALLLDGTCGNFCWNQSTQRCERCADEQPINIGEPDPQPEPTPVPTPIPTPTPSPKPNIRVRAAAGSITSLATDVPASVKPLASVGVEARLSTSLRGPSLEVQADLTALPGDTLDLSDPQSFNALEFIVGLSQPLHPALLFRAYLDVGAASRLATSEDPVNRLPAFWAVGLLFRTSTREHWLKVGIGSDQRLSGDWAPTVTVSGQAKVGERAGVSFYLVGSMIRALDLSAYGYAVPPRDSLRVGVAFGM